MVIASRVAGGVFKEPRAAIESTKFQISTLNKMLQFDCFRLRLRLQNVTNQTIDKTFLRKFKIVFLLTRSGCGQGCGPAASAHLIFAIDSFCDEFNLTIMKIQMFTARIVHNKLDLNFSFVSYRRARTTWGEGCAWRPRHRGP